MTIQGALTIISPIRKSQVDLLRNVLEDMVKHDVEDNPAFPLIEVKTIHFARFVIIPGINGKPDQLLFSSDFDEPLKEHLHELVTKGLKGLHAIYSYCADYCQNNEGTISYMLQYLNLHTVSCNASYVGTLGRSMDQIIQESRLREEIQIFLDEKNSVDGFKDMDALQIRNEIKEYINKGKKFESLLDSENTYPKKPFVSLKLTMILLLALLVLLIIASFYLNKYLGFVIVVFLAIIYITLRILEIIDAVNIRSENLNPDILRKLRDREDKIVQNQLTHIVEIKKGVLRIFILKGILNIVNFFAKYFYTQGNLGGIPSIHFARWIIIDQNVRLVFLSNYDGSWENYLGDFIDKASIGLTAVWSNTDNFPKTHNLIQEGAKDEQNFKHWARIRQIPTDFWYSSYKLMSVENINNNTLIRQGLRGEMNLRNAQKWLMRL